MKLYESVSIKLRGSEPGDEISLYTGTDEQKALDVAAADWKHLSKFDKEHSLVEVRVYEISDDTDINDEDDVVDALCDCFGYDVIASYSFGFQERLREEVDYSNLSQKAFAEKLGVPLRTLEAWLAGARTPNAFTKNAIIEKAEEISKAENN